MDLRNDQQLTGFMRKHGIERSRRTSPGISFFPTPSTIEDRSRDVTTNW